MTNQNPNRIGLLAELLRSVRLAWRLLRDPRISITLKLALPAVMAAYIFLPVDLLPDFLPLAGQLDDLAVVAIGIKLFLDLCPPALVEEHRQHLATGQPTPHRATAGQEGEVVDAEYRVVE